MEPLSLPKVTYVHRRSLLDSEVWAESENNPCSSGWPLWGPSTQSPEKPLVP